jgi:hypothetical protein
VAKFSCCNFLAVRRCAIENHKQQSAAVGGKLLKALTKDQVAQLLSAIFNLSDEQKLNEISLAVDKDISTTLSRLLATKTRGKPPLLKRIVSDQKLIAEWEKLWGDWDEIAEETGEEEGKYIYQEHHWEQPYFTADDLSEDLGANCRKDAAALRKSMRWQRLRGRYF